MRITGIVLTSLMIGLTSWNYADVDVNVSAHPTPEPMASVAPRPPHNPSLKHHVKEDHRHRRVVHRPPLVVVVVPPVAYAQTPNTDPNAITLNGDYATDWANFQQDINHLRTAAQHQLDEDLLSFTDHTKLVSALDGIASDAQARAFDRGGNLNAADFAEFYQRLNQVEDDFQIVSED